MSNLGKSPSSPGQKPRLQAFIEYLNDKRVLSRENLPGLVKFHQGLDRRIGQLALLKGFVSIKDVFSVLTLLPEGKETFGETAQREALLKPDEVRRLLWMQSDPLNLFLESLVLNRMVEPHELDRLLAGFHGVKALPKTRPDRGEGHEPTTRLSREEIRDVIRKIRTLATLPEVIQRVLSLTGEPECDMDKLAGVFGSDPTLSAQLLRLANSASGGAVRRIASVGDAVKRSGLTAVRNLALTIAALRQFTGADRRRIHDIWLHSALTAQWAQAIAAKREVDPPEDAFAAGLVHDVGKAVIIQKFPQDADDIDRMTAEGFLLDEAERQALCHTHADVAAYLFDLWGFPLTVSHAVACHHSAPRTLRLLRGVPPLTNVLNLACSLAGQVFDPMNREANEKILGELDEEFRHHHVIEESLLDLVPEVYQKAAAMSNWLS